MKVFALAVSESYLKDYSKLAQNNSKIQHRLDKTIFILKRDPFHPGLRTHKVIAKNFGETFSSRITGDLRLIWKFDRDIIIILLAMGGHSGKNKVYK